MGEEEYILLVPGIERSNVQPGHSSNTRQYSAMVFQAAVDGVF